MTINRITLGKESGPEDGKNDRHVGTEVLKDHKMAKQPQPKCVSGPRLAGVSPDPTDTAMPDTPPDERGARIAPDPRNPDA